MSQYPPGTTPPGMNPGMPYGGMPQQPQRTTSVAAIFSLICGLIGCIPVLSQLLAFIFGFVGIAATRKPNVGGRGMAIAGIILALLWCVGYGIGGATFGAMYIHTKPARALARQYITDVSSGNIQAAQAESVSGTSATTIQELADEMKPLGTVQDMTLIGTNVQASAGAKTETIIAAVVKFSSAPQAPKGMEIHIVKENGVDKIESASFK